MVPAGLFLTYLYKDICSTRKRMTLDLLSRESVFDSTPRSGFLASMDRAHWLSRSIFSGL